MRKKVFVSGGCGFLGSHVCEYFVRRGDNVVCFDNMTKHELKRTGFAADAARMYNWNFLDKLGVSLVKGDIRDIDSLYEHAKGCDYLVHTAAQPAMTISWEDPYLDMSTNVVGTFNMLEVARRLKTPIACCATIHIYGNKINSELKESGNRYIREAGSVSEDQRTLEGTLTPLHASKAAGDTYVQAYIDTYNLTAASFRLTGIYGTRQFGGEDHGWVANFSIRSVMDWPIVIFGTGKQVRDIIYAHDVCEAFEAFYMSRTPGVYNIGGGSDTSVSLLECIDIIAKIMGKRPRVSFEEERHGDLRFFVCDIAKAKSALEWSPKIMPLEGIRRLIEWIEENKSIFKTGDN